MKTRVTMKVKHLFMIIITVFLVIPLAVMFLVPQVELALAKYNGSREGLNGKEQILSMLDSRILPAQKYKLIEEYMAHEDTLEEYDIFVGPSMTSSIEGEGSLFFSMEEKKPHLEYYFENGPTGYPLKNVAIDLAGEAAQQGEWVEVKSIFTKAKERFTNSPYIQIPTELELAEAHIYIDHRKTREAERLLQSVDIPADDQYLQVEKVKTEVDLLLKQDRIPEALDILRGADPNGELHSLKTQLLALAETEGEGLGRVTGKILRDDGTPIVGAGVFLKEESEANYSISPDEKYEVETDEEGNFEFTDVLPGNYQIHAGFYIEQIDGYTWPVNHDDWLIVDGEKEVTYDITLKPLMELLSPVNEALLTDETLEFQWEEMEGASYYMLQFHVEEGGNSYGFSFDEKVAENQVTIPIERLYNLASNLLLDIEETEEDYFNPATFLGFSNPEGTYSWNVQAYDENGNIIGRSDGYRLAGDMIGNLPILYLKQRELTEEDQLLLEGEIEAALDGYLQNVEENEADLHSLRMITRLIGIKGNGTFEEYERLSRAYFEKLAVLTKDPTYIRTVLQHYYDVQEWEKYTEWYEVYNSVSDEIDGFTKAQYANVLMYQGDYERARGLHHAALKDGEHYYLGNLLALEIYQDTPLEKLKKLVMNNPFIDPHSELNDSYSWSERLTRIQSDESRIEILKEGISLYFNRDEEGLSEWKKQTEERAYVGFINALENID